MITTTFKQLRELGACQSSYKTLARKLGGVRKYGDTKPIPLTVGFEHNFPTEDIIWVLARTDHKATARFCSDCAAHVLHIYEKKHPKDKRPRLAIQAVRDFATGKITRAELNKVRWAAYAADADAAYAADAYAAYAADADAAYAAYADAADAYAAYAADAAAYAADAAAYAADADAADAAAYAADAAAYAADAERKWQRSRLKKYCEGKARPIKI